MSGSTKLHVLFPNLGIVFLGSSYLAGTWALPWRGASPHGSHLLGRPADGTRAVPFHPRRNARPVEGVPAGELADVGGESPRRAVPRCSRMGFTTAEALQADGLVEELDGKVEAKAPAEDMRNSVDTYYKAVMPSKVKAQRRKLVTQALQKEKVMVELAPKMMGESKPKMFHRFMAVP